jgi:DNA sulfur modification protein DndD
MRLLKAEIRNFKLLEDVRLSFSTDASRPLTVIRAENGSGKTSLLYALLWAFYGMPGLPPNARNLRLTSSAAPPGVAVDVSVMVEFDHTGDLGESSRYRLLRSVVETPAPTDAFERKDERLRLMHITEAGEDDVPSAEALIAKLIPLRLRDVFFTNGDDVQRFISGHVSSRERQELVHESIRKLLGLEALRMAKGDIEVAHKRLRSEAARKGGADTTKIEDALESTDAAIAQLSASIDELNDQITNMSSQKGSWEKELAGIRGIGDLDELNERIERAVRDRAMLEGARTRALSRMRDAIRSEAASWGLMDEPLRRGLKMLGDLADRKVIPGTSVEVLRDRLEIEECICGETLPHGSSHRAHVETLLEEQQSISEARQRLTQVFHVARQSEVAEDARENAGETFGQVRTALLQEYVEARDALAGKAREIDHLKERRGLIDEDRVKDLTTKIGGVEAKLATARERLGGETSRRGLLLERRQAQEAELKEAEKAAKASGDLSVKRDVAEDLLRLASDTLDVLEGDYVRRVSARMNELFMEIVGSHAAFEASVFTGVHIDETNFNIVVDTHGGQQLDTDFELNGASQRALTLAFIWALMEVSGTIAPRIIDTPLGMVAGGVKTRMVDIITAPHPDTEFQVVLLLTRSEIRDIEDLLDDRAGMQQTLSASSHYPEDLVYSWGVDHPVARACTCTHRQSCRICARQYDGRHGIEFRDLEATLS